MPTEKAISCENLNCIGTYIEPRTCTFDSEQHSVVTPDIYGVLYPVANFNVYYGLIIGGTNVTRKNVSSITGPGISGEVSYNTQSHCLNLTDASITSLDGNGITTYLDDMKIILHGSNTINAYADAICMGGSDLEIQGPGSLVTESNYGIASHDPYLVNNDSYILSFTNACDVTLNGNDIGIGIDGILAVDHSVVRAKASSTSDSSASVKCTDLQLTGTGINSPAGAYFEPNTIRNSGGSTVKGKYVVIAEELYDIWVGDVQVSAINASDVLGDGHVIFDVDSLSLTLNNATINNIGDGGIGIMSHVDGLEIILIGDNTINSSSKGVFTDVDHTTFSGSGRLTVNADNGIWVGNQANCEMTFTGGSNVVVNATNGVGVNNLYGVVAVNRSELRVKGTSVCIVCQDMNLTETSITAPYGASFNSSAPAPAVTYQGTNDYVKNEYVVISASPYNLWVQGTQVTVSNAFDVLGDGTVSYDATQKTLTLRNAVLTSNTAEGIYNEIPNLNIVLEGANTINAYTAGIFSAVDCNIRGEGTLNVSGNDGIKSLANLTISGPGQVNATANGSGAHAAILGAIGMSLTIHNSYVSTICAQGTKGPVYGFSNFYTNDCAVWAPDNTVWNSNSRCFEKNGYPVITANGVRPQVVIAPNNLNLLVGTNRVTCQNASNITGDGIVSGTISFNPLNKELLFDNATVMNQMPGVGAVNSHLDGLSIKLIGNNSFTSPLGIAFYANNTTITGSGYLTIDAAFGISSSNSNINNLTIEDGCEITIVNSQEGVLCSNSDIVIDASKLNIKNAQCFAFQARSLTMDNVYIAEPNGAFFNTAQCGVCYSGTDQYVTNLVIAPDVYNLWIGNDQVTRENAAHFTSSSVTGTIQYDAINNVLTLDNASINVSNINALRSMMPTLTINLIGANSIDAEGNGIWSDEGCNLIIKGANGTLSVAGSQGINTGGDLTICDGCTVNATGTASMGGYGICSHGANVQYSGTLSVLNSIVNIESSRNYIPAISHFEHLVLRGCEFVSPDDAVWDDESHSLDNTSHTMISQLSIAPHPYPLMVNGIQVTAANFTDVLGDGAVSYDPDENILTLENANIVSETPLVDGIVNNSEGLRINLIGNNTINVTNEGLYLGSVNTTILGHGTLDITAAIGVSTSATSNYTLTITDGCQVTIHALSGYGIYLPNGTLAINGAALNSTGHSPYASVACNALSMTGVSITQPNNAQFWGGEVHYSQGTEPVCTQVSINPNPYDLWVAGTQVTFANCYDVLEDGGSVCYDAQNNVLTLNNASISLNNSGYGIQNEINGLRINLVGFNSITTNSGSCVYTVSANLTISGRGELHATAPVAAITARASHLTIEGGCTVYATTTGGSSYSAIRGVDAPNSLTITNSTVYATAEGSSLSAISQFYDFTLNGCSITTPEDAVWNFGVESNGNPATAVTIRPDFLNLMVDGIPVTTDIADDVLGDGTVSYDVANNILTLNNANLTHANAGVSTTINDMTIKLVGSNIISASQMAINAYACNHLIVEGPGTLSVDSTMDVIEVCGTLEIRGGCSIYANACNIGFYNNWSGGNLYITNSSVYIFDANFYPIVGYDDFILNGCRIISPEGGVWNDEFRCIFDANGQIAKSLTIEPYSYDLWVAGVHVTSAIADDILGDGKVVYNSVENTLTLNNASIITEDEIGILNKIENLTVKLMGDNTISANSPSFTAGIGSQEDITIEGPGTLEVSGAYAIMVEGNLTIEGVRGMTATASGYRYYSAIHGNMDNTLTIINSDVKAFALNSADNGAISNFEDMILEGCYISSPDYANYNTTDQYVWAEGNPVDSVYISPNPYNLWVAGIQVTTANADDILGNGKVRFDASNNVLVLDNVTFSNEEPNGVGIMNKINGLTIIPVGLCSVTGDAKGIHSLNCDLTIDGQGWLLVYGKAGIVVENAYLNVQGGCQLEATATGANYFYAIFGSLDYALKVTNSSVVAKANHPVGSTIYGFSYLSLDGCYIMTPEGAIWNSSSRALELDGNTVTTEVRIMGVTYPLVVNDIQVSSANYSNVLGDGSVSYDPDTHTLTLNNISIENHYGNGHSGTAIKNEGVDNLIIVLYGDNTISADEGIAMGDYAATITGPGTLSIDAEWGYGIVSNMFGMGDLTVYGVPSLEINAYYAGIVISSSLYVTNSEMKVTGSVEGSISCGGYPWFQGCQITEPEDASWQYKYVEQMGIWRYYVCNNSMEIITEQVVISPEDYHMWVGGVAVTSINCSDVLGDGTVCYDPMMNTLTLNNANIVCMEEEDYFAAGIRYQSEWPGAYLSVELIGNNSITAGYYGINIGDANFNIEGNGYLYIEAPCGIYGDGVESVAQVYGSTVEINATNLGVSIYDGTLSVQYGELRATGSSGASIMCAALSLDGCRIMTPEGAEFNSSNHRVELNNAAVKTQVVIKRDVYNLYVAGVQVTLDNAANITGEGISGSVSYDIDNNVLILNNVTITTAYQGIQNFIPDLTIRTIGTNTITVNNNTGINTSDDMIIDGSGILNLTGSDAIIAQMNLTIQGGCSLNLTSTGTGSYSGIWGNDSYSLNIINSFVRAKSDNTNKGAIYGFGQFNLTGCSVTNPLYVEWDENQHTLINGGSIAKDVTISPDAFDLWIGDTRVNVGNANDVFGDGTVSFNPTTSELTLNNATVVSYTMDGIHSELLGLTIHLIGVNNVTAAGEYSDGIEALRDVVIEGGSDAVLNTTGRMGLFTSNGDLTIQGGCTVHAIGNMNGRCGIYNYSSTSTLTVSGSMVVAECPGMTYAFISGFNYLVLNDCVITEPEGGYWMTELMRIYDPSNSSHEREVISPIPYNLWVAGTRVNILNASDILGDGKVSYDATTNELTLNSAMIQSETGYGIQNGIDNLTVVLEGNDMTRIMAPMSRSIYSTGDNMTISGNGRMMTMGGIETTGDLTINGGCNIMVHGQEHVGMVGTSTHSLTVEGSTVIVDGMENTIMGYGSLNLKRAEVVEPVGGSYQSTGYVNSNNQLANMVNIQPVAMNIFTNVSGNSWSEASNWSEGAAPSAPGHKAFIDGNCVVDDDVTINLIEINNDASLTVASGYTLTAQTILANASYDVIVEDGAQLVHGNSGLQATMKKYVRAWNIGAGWNLVSMPTTVTAFANTDLGDGEYDLYRYNETNHEGEEWNNYKETSFSLEAGRGYLYASEEAGNHYFSGTLNLADVTYSLTYTTPQGNYPLAGFNLIGNPYAHNIYKGADLAIDDENLAEGYYVLDNDGTWQAKTDDEPIAPCQAILVCTSEATELTIANTTAAPSAKGSSKKSVGLSVFGNGMNDQVFIHEGNSQSLNKVAHLNAAAPMLFFEESGSDYAIVVRPDVEGQYALCFKAGVEGSYTIGLTGADRGVVLVDVLTGVEVDLSEGSYTFKASPIDTVERFKVIVK